MSAPDDLSHQIPVQRFGGSSGKTGVFLEQPLQNFLVLIPAIVQDRQEPGQTFDDLTVTGIEKHFGDSGNPVPLDCEELSVAEHLLDSGLRHFENLADIRQLQQGDGRVEDIVGIRDCAHSGNVNGFELLYEKHRCRTDAHRESR